MPLELPSLKRLLTSKHTAIAVILLVSFGVYINALFNGFVFDDLSLVLGNPWIKDIRSIPDIFSSSLWSFHTSVPQNYFRPMFHIFYMLDYHIFGFRPWGFHLTKILFHMGSSLLVFFMASTIINRYGGGAAATETSKQYIPFVAALLFATHPIHTEAVLGITEVSLAFFYFLSFYLYVRADVTGRGVSVSSLAFFFLAALSKETALTLPVLLFAYDFSFKRIDKFKHLIKRYLPYLAVSGIYFILRIYALGGFAPTKVHADLSTYQYFINVFPLFAGYLEKLVLPVNLNAAYVFHPISSVLEWRGTISLVVTTGFIITLYLLRNRNRVVFFSLLWVVIPLLPAFYIPALGEHIFAERYLYLPSVGFVIIVSVGLCGIASLDALRGMAVPIMLSIVFVITALYSVGTIKRNPVWKNELTLWSDTVKKSPDSYISHNNLGFAYYNLGRTDEAIEELILALRLKPFYAGAHNNLGNALAIQNRIDEAIEEYKLALRLEPDNAGAHNNLGTAYHKQGRIDEAIESYMLATSLRPGLAEAHNNLGDAYADQGRTDEAIEEYRVAARLEPNFALPHYNLGNVYLNLGQLEKAIRQYKYALRLEPGFAEAHNNLGGAYADQGRTDEAIEEYRVASRLDPNFASPHYNLGNVYFNLGRLEKAVQQYQHALRLKPDHARAHNNLGFAYYNQGRLAEAIGEYNMALKLNPEDELAYSNLGIALEKLGRLAEAIEAYKQALDLKPDFAEAHYNLGNAYQKTGQMNEAMKEFESAFKLKPDITDAYRDQKYFVK
jgi:tetratricopeptide (TPR) repeat protein